MQFNNDISVQFNTLNEFGELAPSETHTIKCSVLSLLKGRRITAGDSRTTYFELKILVPYKDIHPYSALLTAKDLSFIYQGLNYMLVGIEPINNFSGRIKYFEIDLKEQK